MNTSAYNANRLVLESSHPHLLPLLENQPSVPFLPTEESYGTEALFPPPPGMEEIPSRYVAAYGLGTGEGILSLYQETASELYRLVLVEPSEERFARVMRERDLSALLGHPRVAWIVGEFLGPLESRLREDLAAVGTWGIRVRVQPSLREESPAYFRGFAETIRRLSSLAYENSQIQIDKGRILQENIVGNLPWILRSAGLDAWENRFSGVPAIVIGAGPSLDRNIECLREVPDGVLLVAVDTALRPLRRQKIQPHVVVSCDPLPLNFRHFEGIPDLGEAVYAFLPETNHAILEKYDRHERLLCLHDWQPKVLRSLLNESETRVSFQRGMNVGFCAFSLARQLGCSPLILTGLDLAIAPGESSHARETGNASSVVLSEDGKKARLEGNVHTQPSPVVEVEGYFGRPVLTFEFFHQVLRLFEREIARTSVPVIDATEGGARKRGAIQCPLREALAELPAARGTADRIRDLCRTAPGGEIAGVEEKLVRLIAGLQQSRNQLRAGLYRLRQRQEQSRGNPIVQEELGKEIEFFLGRWNNLLQSRELDEALDIALAPWRYATRRAVPPPGLLPAETANFWHPRFEAWFRGLLQEVDRFGLIYTNTLQRVRIGLTSIPERQ